MKEITSVTRPNELGYIIRTPWVGSLLSWTPSFKTMLKNSVTSIHSYSNREGEREGESAVSNVVQTEHKGRNQCS